MVVAEVKRPIFTNHGRHRPEARDQIAPARRAAGDRDHQQTGLQQLLERAVGGAVMRPSVVIVPSMSHSTPCSRVRLAEGHGAWAKGGRHRTFAAASICVGWNPGELCEPGAGFGVARRIVVGSRRRGSARSNLGMQALVHRAQDMHAAELVPAPVPCTCRRPLLRGAGSGHSAVHSERTTRTVSRLSGSRFLA